MGYFTANWGHPVVAVAGVVLIAAHERGLRSLNRRSIPAHATRRRHRLLLSYAGIAVVVLSISSPLEFWSMQYFWVHMLQHISIMLAAPALYVAGAPIIPLLHAVPVDARRKVLRRIYRRDVPHPLRRIAAAVLSPMFAVVFFNVVMVVWMIPSVFDPVMESESLHIGLMLSTFLASGILFWIQFIPSRPLKRRLTPVGRAGALVLTNLVMTVLAVSLSFFSSVADFRFGTMVMDMGSMVMPATVITINRVADQHIGAAILWVCGDFWCFPALFLAIREALHDESRSAVFDRFLRGQQSVSAEEYRSGKFNSLP